MKIVLASNNKGKIAELKTLFSNFSILPLSDFSQENIAETGLTFIENALIKARFASRVSNLAALADDSGLVVEALHGAPGIYSARYAGPNATDSANCEKLLKELNPCHERSAYFYCCLVFLRHATDPAPIVAEGKWHGTILNTREGSNGFGYDPVFYVPAFNKSAAQLSSDEKNSMSHRSIAAKILVTQLREIL